MATAMPEALQVLSDDVAPTGAAALLAGRLLMGELSVESACERVSEHFLSDGEAEIVVVALTLTPPEDQDDWIRLGDRVWLREWVTPGSPCRSVPRDGSEGALTMPYLSQWARDQIVALSDRDLLPPEGAVDRDELEQCGTAAIVSCALQRDAAMYGSISVGRSRPGQWSQQLLADYRLLSAALAAGLAAQHDRALLTDALAVGEQARHQQQQFFATVGHELRTPLSTIIGYAELLTDQAERQSPGEFAEEVGRDAGHVLTASEHLLDVVEDLLGTGRLLGSEDSRRPVEVVGAVADVLHWHRVTAGKHGVTVASVVPEGLQVLVRPAGLRQVLTNLVGNAIVHNRRGGTVEVGAQPLVGEGGQPRVRVTVRDTGRGLSAVQLRSAFEPFVRFAGSSVKGTGLGLPLARTVAERDGGEIGAESTPGQGSVFWVDLPAV